MQSEGEGLLSARVWGSGGWNSQTNLLFYRSGDWGSDRRKLLEAPRGGFCWAGPLQAGQGGGWIKHHGAWGPCAFIGSSLPDPAWGPGMFTTEQDIAGNHESRGEGIKGVELTSGSKSLSLSFQACSGLPRMAESEGCPQLCFQIALGARWQLGEPRAGSAHRGKESETKTDCYRDGRSFCSKTYERKVVFARGLSVRGSMALSRGQQTFPVKIVNIFVFQSHADSCKYFNSSVIAQSSQTIH